MNRPKGNIDSKVIIVVFKTPISTMDRPPIHTEKSTKKLVN
jgi:hypothetical protein